MKIRLIKFCVLSLVVTLIASSADAQRTGRRRGQTTTPNQSQEQQTQQNNDNRPPVNYNPNIPIEVDTGSGPNVTRRSLRNDGIVDNPFISERTPL
ncbi:MAG: hypothetical protein EOO01_43815, partial [Chitinophagaceae bacterium]